MKISLGKFLGNDPACYARKVLQECGFRHPPISERVVADYLELEIKEFSLDSTPEGDHLLDVIRAACSWLQRKPDGKCRIWVHRNTRLERKRMSIFHECGHAIIPWHDRVDYLCKESDVEPPVHKLIEREAFACGSEFLMPREMFLEDVLSMKTSISGIEQLRHRYVASMEATAIRYAYTHPGLCGVVMVEPAEKHQPKVAVQDPTLGGQLALPFRIPHTVPIQDDGKVYPLRVKYSVKSHRFPKYIRPGVGIEANSPIYRAWTRRRLISDEIPASAFGSSAKWAYHAECIPLGTTGRVLTLLWLPDHQLKLDLKNGVIL